MNLPIKYTSKKRVLVTGAGGGLDFLCGLPIVLQLMEDGHEVFVANYSFTKLADVGNGKWLTDDVLEINHRSYLDDETNFYEVHLCRWFKDKKQMDVPVILFPITGIQPLKKAYEFVKNHLNIDVAFVVDGGVDGLFRGDEFDMGTPSMDSISVIAASLAGFKEGYYVMTGFGSEGIDKEVSHCEVLQRMAELTEMDAFPGVASITRNSSIGRDFIDGVNSVFKNLHPRQHGVILCSVVHSMYGWFGDKTVNAKTTQIPVWLSPLTNLYWFTEINAVAKMKLFYEDVVNTYTVMEVSFAIEKLRETRRNTTREPIPI